MDWISLILFLIIFGVLITLIVLYFTGYLSSTTGPVGPVGPQGPTGPQGIPGTAVNTGATGPPGITQLPDYGYMSLTHAEVVPFNGLIAFNSGLSHGGIQQMNADTLILNQPGIYQVSFGINNAIGLLNTALIPASVTLTVNNQVDPRFTLQAENNNVPVPRATSGGVYLTTILTTTQVNTQIQLKNTGQGSLSLESVTSDSVLAYINVMRIN